MPKYFDPYERDIGAHLYPTMEQERRGIQCTVEQKCAQLGITMAEYEKAHFLTKLQIGLSCFDPLPFVDVDQIYPDYLLPKAYRDYFRDKERAERKKTRKPGNNLNRR